MMKTTFLIFIFALALSGHAFASELTSDAFMDKVLNKALRVVTVQEKLDPIQLADIHLQEENSGRVHFYEGSIEGLSNVKRANKCSEPQKSKVTGSTVIYCALIFPELKASFKGKFNDGSTPVTFQATEIFTDVYIEAQIIQLPEFYRHKFVIIYLPKAELGKSSKIDIMDSGLLNKPAESLKKTLDSYISFLTGRILRTRFQCALSVAVGEVPMPSIN